MLKGSKSEQRARSTKCIFCETSKGITKEHLFGKWLVEYFPRDELTEYFKTYVAWMDDTSPHTPAQKQEKKQGHVGSKRLKIVCRDCNNGWLSQLETEVRSALTPLILGHRNGVTPEIQELLATWASKTAMVAEFDSPTSDGISQAERSHLRTFKRPPDNWFVWIAAYSGHKWGNLSFSQVRIASNPTTVGKQSRAMYHGQATTFGVGCILFSAVSSTDPGVMAHFAGREPEGLFQIWPAHPRSILWPPRLVCGDKEAEAIANIFNTSKVFDQSRDPGANWKITI